MKIQLVDQMPARVWGRPPGGSRYDKIAQALLKSPEKVARISYPSHRGVVRARVAISHFPERFGIHAETVCPGGIKGRTLYVRVREALTAPAEAATMS